LGRRGRRLWLEDLELIEVHELTHDYGDFRAVSGVSFRVEPGQVYGYLGPNGAGKSTTVKVLLGLLAPTSGSVTLAGVDVRKDPVGARAKSGYVPEVASLYEALTAVEHLKLVGRLRGLDEGVIDRRSEALLDTFDLTARAGEPIRSYSKGMRQKVALALAFLHRPDVLVMDEPLSGLDASAALILKRMVRGMADAGSAVLYCSHVLDVVERLCDRALILNKGQVVAEGSIDELRQKTEGTTLDEVFRSVATDVDPEARANALLEVLQS